MGFDRDITTDTTHLFRSISYRFYLRLEKLSSSRFKLVLMDNIRKDLIRDFTKSSRIIHGLSILTLFLYIYLTDQSFFKLIWILYYFGIGLVYEVIVGIPHSKKQNKIFEDHIRSGKVHWEATFSIDSNGEEGDISIYSLGVFHSKQLDIDKNGIETFRKLYFYTNGLSYELQKNKMGVLRKLWFVAIVTPQIKIVPLIPLEFVIDDEELNKKLSMQGLLTIIYKLYPELIKTDGYYYETEIGHYEPRNFFCSFDHLGIAHDLLGKKQPL